jgi:hypothetical protein
MRARRVPAHGAPLVIVSCLLAIGALALAGCAGTSRQSTPAALKLQRDDLLAATRALASVRGSVSVEVGATKAAWTLIANGLPAEASSVSRATQAVSAAQSASELTVPSLFSEARAATLTGPASELAGVFRSYVLLSKRGWSLLDASLDQIATGTPAGAGFARANAPLYIESIYDGHFSLAQIGKKLLAGYAKLGGPADFGATLTQAEVDALAATYSEASDRLHPHVGVRLGS